MLLYVVSELAEALPKLRHVVCDCVVVHHSAGQVAAAFSGVQSVHHDLSVTKIFCVYFVNVSYFSRLINLSR